MADPNMGNVYANDNRIVLLRLQKANRLYGYKFQFNKKVDFVISSFTNKEHIREGQGDEKFVISMHYLGKKYL